MEASNKERASISLGISSSNVFCLWMFAFILVCELGLQSNAVIVDGKKKGPSAQEDQSPEQEMIDGYNTKNCGISDPELSEHKFVNMAREGQFPWLASFQIVKPDNTTSHFCMGSFISDRWILSAAHCFADPNLKPFLETSKIKIQAGSANAYHKDNKVFHIKRIFYHSRFDRSSPVGFDVSLVEVNEKAQLRPRRENRIPYINSICLPIEGKEYTEGQHVRIGGWGDTQSKDPNSKPDQLLTTDLLLTNATQCAAIFTKKLSKVKRQFDNFHDFICADYHGERDACQGDSGGALHQYADQLAVVIGIVSYGLGCATKGVPGIYSRTSSYLPWIKDITQHKEMAKVQFTLVKLGKQDGNNNISSDNNNIQVKVT